MRVLYDGQLLSDEPSGIGRYLFNLLSQRAFRNPAYEHIIAADRRTASIAALERQSSNFRVEILNRPGWLPRAAREVFWEQVQLPQSRRRLRADLLFVPHISVPLWNSPRVVMVMHDAALFVCSKNYSILTRAYRGAILRLSTQRMPAIITVSQSSKTDILRFLKIKSEKVHVVYSGRGALSSLDQDDRFWAPAPDSEPPFVLYAGGFGMRKNLTRLIEAYAVCISTYGIRERLVMVGKCNDVGRAAMEQVRKLGLDRRVLFPGYVSDDELRALYRGARATVYLSEYEGFGFPVVESMALGTPVLTSSVSSMPEIAGGAALLVAPSDIAAISRALHAILSDQELRKRLIGRGKIVSSMFSWQNAAERVLEILR